MIETITNWLNAVFGWAASIPQPGWAILLGFLFGVFLTQWIKKTFPIETLFPGKSKTVYVTIIRIYALLAAMVPTYLLWPVEDIYRPYAALAVGVMTPIVYKTGTHFIYKKWPDLEDRWSGTE